MCGLPIDASLPNLDPCQGVVDELVPVSRGGSPYDPGNCAAAHRCCNNWRKAKAMAVVRRVGTLVEGMGGAASPQEWCAKASVALRALRHGVTSVESAPPRPTTDW